MKEQELKNRIMRRVYVAYYLRRIFSRDGIKVMVLALFAWEISPFSPYLSVRHIFANMPNVMDVRSFYEFNLFAFTHTQPLVQISLIMMAAVMASYAYGLLRYFSGTALHSGSHN